MPVSFKFFLDSSLTQEVNPGNPIQVTQNTAGGLTIAPIQLWFGSTAVGTKVQASSNPGVDAIVIGPADSNGATGQTVSAVRMATSSAGCAGATPGAGLSLGVQVLSGVGNAFPFWVLIDDETGVVGLYSDLSIDTNLLDEMAV